CPPVPTSPPSSPPERSQLRRRALPISPRSGAFGPEDARHLFDELRRRGTLVPERALNGFLAALARAPSSVARRNVSWTGPPCGP
ncbi:unnamed protein product, partial [Urochloa humidicola]